MSTMARRCGREAQVLSMAALLLTSTALWGALSGCSDRQDTEAGHTTERSIAMSIELRSDAFEAGGVIPRRHTGDGEDLSPPLTWSGVPADAEELALIVDDPDAPRSEPWFHWVMYKIPPTLGGMPEGMPATAAPAGAGGALQGVNDFGAIGYGGPAPPRGHGMHHYHFKLYALDTKVALETGAGKKALLAAMTGHVLAQGELVGTYER